MQNRILKGVIVGTDTTRTYYIRDAQGNVMSVYRRKRDTVTWQEVHLYGSSRLGVWEPKQRLTPSVDTAKKWQIREGQKRYELTNHLGNVLVTISDRRQGAAPASSQFTYYEAVVITATDYYPFGMSMPNRDFKQNTEGYRYSFNGKEDDNEWGVQDYGMRIYDEQIGRFLSVDPIGREYPELTPYQFASNTPILAIDLDGLEGVVSTPTYRTGPVQRNIRGGRTPQPSAQQRGVPITSPSTPARPIRNGRLQPVIEYNNDGQIVGVSTDARTIPTTGEIRPTAGYFSKGFQIPVLFDSDYYGMELEQVYDDYRKSMMGPYNRPPKDDSDLGYTAYVTIRDNKKSKGLVKRALFYTGIMSAPRYDENDIEKRNFEVIGGEQWRGRLTKGLAHGIEQALIELNNSGKPFPKTSKTLDNELNSTEPGTPTYYSRKIQATIWLNQNIPDWQTRYHRPNVQDNQDQRRRTP
jgi:RHS repeat-associated protein